VIPAVFKQDANLQIKVFDFDVNVVYTYHWPREIAADKEPLTVHLEFRSDYPVISQTGYRSHFLFAASLQNCSYLSIADLATALGHHLARENGYQPPQPDCQLSLF
jgi:hypothetical protein